MLSALFLDPRFKSELTQEQVQIAKNYLADFWMKVKSQNEGELNVDDQDANTQKDPLEEYFLNKGLEKAVGFDEQNEINTDCSQPNYGLTREGFLESLKLFEQQPRLHHKRSILEFWESKKAIFPEIYIVACAIFSIPPTQITVERQFSCLSLVYSNRRTQMSQAMLENILTIKLNKKVVNQIFEDEIKAEEQKANESEKPTTDRGADQAKD